MDNEIDLKILQVEPSKDWQDRTLARLKVLRDQPAAQKKQKNYVKFALPFGILAFSTVLIITVLLNPNLIKQEKVLPKDNIDSILTSIKYPFEITDTSQMLGGSMAALDDRTMMAAPFESAVLETTDSLEFTEFDDYTTKLDTTENEVKTSKEQEANSANILENTLPVVDTNLIRIGRINYSYGPATCSMIDQGFRENRSITKLRITGEKNIFAEIEEKIISSLAFEAANNVQNNISLQVINENGSQIYTKTFDGFVDSYELENIFEVWNQAFNVNFGSLTRNARQTGFNEKWSEIEVTDKILLDCGDLGLAIKEMKPKEQEVTVIYKIHKDTYEIISRTFYLNGKIVLTEDYFSKEFEYTNLLKDWDKIISEWGFGDFINKIISDLDGFIRENFKDSKDKTN